MKRILIALTAALLAAGAPAQTPAPAAASSAPESPAAASAPAAGAEVYIISPHNGATVHGPVTVLFGLKGMGIAPAGTKADNTGHHHLLIDTDLGQVNLEAPLPATDKIRHFGKGQTETTLELAPGRHTLQLLFGDYVHRPFQPSLQSAKITITVK
jgi:hypothetical protein